MKEFTHEDWQKECQNIRKAIRAFNSLNDESLPVYSELMPLTEPVIDVETFISEIKKRRGHIYNTICKICCLEKTPFADDSWEKELFQAFSAFVDTVIIDGISKRETLLQHFIEPCVSAKTYEPEEDDLFIRAMNLEVSKASKPTTSISQCSPPKVQYIQENILPNISIYRQANAKRIASLLKRFLDAEENKDVYILNTAIKTFVNTQTATNINASFS